MKLKANHRGLHFFVGVVLVQRRRQTLLDKKLARLVAMSDVRTDERLGYELTRAVAIGDIIRELPPVDDKRDMRTD